MDNRRSHRCQPRVFAPHLQETRHRGHKLFRISSTPNICHLQFPQYHYDFEAAAHTGCWLGKDSTTYCVTPLGATDRITHPRHPFALDNGCNSTLNSSPSSAQPVSYVDTISSSSAIAPQSSPPLRYRLALVPNMNNYSSPFVNQIFASIILRYGTMVELSTEKK